MLGNAMNKILADFISLALRGWRCRYAPGLCLLGCRGHLVEAPAPAERLVDGDEGDHRAAFALNELVFRRVDGTLGVEDREEALQAAGVAVRGQLQGSAVRRDRRPQRLLAPPLARVRRERVLHLFQ